MAGFTNTKETLARGIFEPDGVTIGSNSGQIASSLSTTISGSIQRVFYTATGSGENATPTEWSASNYATYAAELNAAPSNAKQAVFVKYVNYATGSAGYNSVTRVNSNGYSQLLFMDIFPAFGYSPSDPSVSSSIGDPNYAGPIMLYFHGGGFNSGAANFTSTANETINQFRAAGFHCVSVEYRRGWTLVTGSLFGLDSTASPERQLGASATLVGYYAVDQSQFPAELDTNHGNRFLQTALGTSGYAIQDCVDAWDWVDNNIKDILPNAVKKYVVQGQSAGGSLTAQLTYAHDGGSSTLSALQNKVIGSINSFGGYTASAAIDTMISNRECDYPILLQFCGVDKLVPIRDNKIYYQTNMPVSRGTYDQYEMLSGSGKNVYAYWTPLGNHGYDGWNYELDYLGSEDLVNCEYVNFALNLINKKISGETLPPNHWMCRIDTAFNRLSESFDYPGPGYYTNLTDSEALDLYNTGAMYNNIPFYANENDFWFYTSSTVETSFPNFSVANLLSGSEEKAIEWLISESAQKHAIADAQVGTALAQTNPQSYLSNYPNFADLHYGDSEGTEPKGLYTYTQMSASIVSNSAAKGTDPFV